jgi:hypothetical protein
MVIYDLAIEQLDGTSQTLRGESELAAAPF